MYVIGWRETICFRNIESIIWCVHHWSPNTRPYFPLRSLYSTLARNRYSHRYYLLLLSLLWLLCNLLLICEKSWNLYTWTNNMNSPHVIDSEVCGLWKLWGRLNVVCLLVWRRPSILFDWIVTFIVQIEMTGLSFTHEKKNDHFKLQRQLLPFLSPFRSIYFLQFSFDLIFLILPSNIFNFVDSKGENSRQCLL